jgi:hypothetical protein
VRAHALCRGNQLGLLNTLHTNSRCEQGRTPTQNEGLHAAPSLKPTLPALLPYPHLQAAQQREAGQAAAAAAAAQQAAKRAAARAAAQQLPRPGPHLEASDTQLCMHYTIPSHR